LRNAGTRIGPGFSVYLDLVRFGAAFVVFLSHACEPGRAEAVVPWLGWLGVESVDIFFVMSGFVIMHTARSKDHSLGAFVRARLARLWSVAIPALLLAALLAPVASLMDAPLFAFLAGQDTLPGLAWLDAILRDWWPLRFLIGASFLNEAWSMSLPMFGNPPYWSLSYEVCYYALFAGTFYLRGAARVAAVVGVLVLFGPKIQLLLPIWLLGVALYWFRPKGSALLGWTLAGTAVVLFVLAKSFQLSQLARPLNDVLPFRIGQSFFFLWQYAVGFLVTTHLVGMRMVTLRWPAGVERTIRRLAGQTFSLYLFHLPIMNFLAVALPMGWGAWWRGAANIVLTLLACHLLSRVTEARKDVWARALDQVFARRAARR
jgi:peptidoglycan/LPS O-acetylase OafA/YrhL